MNGLSNILLMGHEELKISSDSLFTGGRGGNFVSSCYDECLAFKAAILVSLNSANESSEEARQTTPLKLPSSKFIETEEASHCNGSFIQTDG